MPSKFWNQFDKLLCTFLILTGLSVMIFLVKTATPDNTLLEWIKTFVSTVTGYLGGLITGRAVQRQADVGIGGLANNPGANSTSTATRTTETKLTEELTTDTDKEKPNEKID